MMKIALLEGKHHVEVVANYVQLFDLPSVKLSVIANERVIRELDSDTETQYIGDRREIADWDSSLEKFDLLLITTYFDGVVSYLKKLHNDTTVILVVHNVHYIFQKNFYRIPHISVFNVIRYLKHKVIERIYKRDLISHIDYFTFSSKSNFVSASELYPENVHKFVEPIYHNYYKDKTRLPSSALTIIIPGTIRPSDRDYTELYEAVRLVLQQLDRTVCFYFLGCGQTQEAKKIIETFKILESGQLEIKYDQGVLSYVDYNSAFSNADFAILPLRTTIPFLSGYEQQGETVWAGTLNDVIRYRMPSLIKGDFEIEAGMTDYCIRYKTSLELSVKLLDWINNLSFKGLIEQKEIFSKDMMMERNMRIINRLL